MKDTFYKKLRNFWSEYALVNLDWKKEFTDTYKESRLRDYDDNKYFSKFSWFVGGEIDLKRTLFKGKRIDQVIISSYQTDGQRIDITYFDLLGKCFEVTQEILSADMSERIMIIGKASSETATVMIASALIGRCHCVLFEDLSLEAILCRINIFKPALIYIRSSFDKDKFLRLQPLAKERGITIKKYSGFYDNLSVINPSNYSNFCEDLESYKLLPDIPIESQNYLFCLFTSGSTGQPKAIWHSFGGYLVYSSYSFKKYLIGAGAKDGIFCGTDAAWINGHTYGVYGPLLTGTKTIFIEDINSLQHPRKLQRFLEATKPSFFYCSVTLLRAIRSFALITGSKSVSDDLIGVVGIGSCGETLANDVAKWALHYFKCKNKFVVNTYFQTETGGILVAPLETNGESTDHSTVGRSDFPVRIDVCELDKSLSVPDPWPGCFSMVTCDRKPRYWDQKRGYLLHDLGHQDQSLFLYVDGRIDDVINISGHRVSTGEIESTTLSIDERIYEAAAVELDDSIAGKKIVLFYVLSNGLSIDDKLIKSCLVQKLTPYHRPWKVIQIGCLPKTKSGKIARRILRKVAKGDNGLEEEDLSTIVNYIEFVKALEKL